MEMAGHPMIRLDFQERGDFNGTGFKFIRAAGMKITSRRWIDGTGHFPLQDDSFPFQGWIGDGVGREQRLGVRVLGVAVKIVAHGKLGDPPQMHHRHPVADVFDYM